MKTYVLVKLLIFVLINLTEQGVPFTWVYFTCNESLRGQTAHSLYCKRNPQQAKIIFVAESAALLLFFDFLCCFGFHKCEGQKEVKKQSYVTSGFFLQFVSVFV